MVYPEPTALDDSRIVYPRNSASSEVADKSYNFLGKDIKSNVGRLISGEFIMSHPVYGQPVKIILPRPTYKVQEF
jgi:hypothetical protein